MQDTTLDFLVAQVNTFFFFFQILQRMLERLVNAQHYIGHYGNNVNETDMIELFRSLQVDQENVSSLYESNRSLSTGSLQRSLQRTTE